VPNGGRLTVGVVAVALCALSFCARAEEPERPRTNEYPSLGDQPAKPEKPAMTGEDISKLKRDLTSVRDRQAPKSKTKAEPMKP
jgi:hypothetical protein